MKTYKKGDDGDPLKAQLLDEDGAIDLTDASDVKVLFYGDGEQIINRSVTIENATDGKVSYSWQTDDPIYTKGTYKVEFRILTSAGQMTVPNEGFVSLAVE